MSKIREERFEAPPKQVAGSGRHVPVFRYLRLPSVQFDFADMTNARADHADFRFATFVEARLTGASLTSSLLDGADFSGADLSYADLRSASLDGANFRNAEIVGADLRGTDLRKTSNMTVDMIASATTDASTLLPDEIE